MNKQFYPLFLIKSVIRLKNIQLSSMFQVLPDWLPNVVAQFFLVSEISRFFCFPDPKNMQVRF